MSLDVTTPQGISADFNDRLSEQLLLQPDAEFLFARLAYSAKLGSELSAMDPEAFNLAKMQLLEGRIPSGAGVAANMAEAMSQGMGGSLLLSNGLSYPDMVSYIAEAKMPGEVIKLNRPKFINGLTTPANRLGSPAQKLFGSNSQSIGMDQVPVTIVEYLGPCDPSGNLSPISLPRFTLQRATHDLLVNVGLQLRRDRIRFVDDLLINQLSAAGVAAGYVTRPQGVASRSAYTANGNEPFGFDLVVGAVKAFKDRSIPGVNGEAKYPFFCTTQQIKDLKLDPQYGRLAVFEPKYNPLFPGYVATVDGAIICESSRLNQITGQGQNSAVTIQQGMLVAPGAIGWGCAEDAHALRNTNDDGGRSNEFGWQAYEGWQVLDDRFIQVVETD